MHCKMVEAQEYDIGTQAAETLDIWNYRNGLGRASGGEGGIRTLGTHEEYNGFRDRPDRPLRHLSAPRLPTWDDWEARYMAREPLRATDALSASGTHPPAGRLVGWFCPPITI